MPEPLDEYGYPRKPRNLSQQAWFYEERSGLTICQRMCGQEGQIATIAWRKLEAAVDRHRKIKRRKKAK